MICIDKHRIYGNGNDCVNVIPKNAISKPNTDNTIHLIWMVKNLDKMKFDRNFKRIQSNGAFILVNSAYKPLFKEDLWKAIEEEEVLYKGAGNGWNATVGAFVDLPNYDAVISTQAKLWNTLEQKLNAK